jgi:hypothetical protein
MKIEIQAGRRVEVVYGEIITDPKSEKYGEERADCTKCVFLNYNSCDDVNCFAATRPDGREVHFILAKE